ncbi:MAG: tetratricopeptide repeat protein [Leptospirales bacterium]|nr:tetratricopeptide repeat protein [Leptospirales bacterium]
MITCIKRMLIIGFIIILPLNLSANLKYENDNLRIKIYFSYNDKNGTDAVVKGKIISLSISEDLSQTGLADTIDGKTKATVRLIDKEGLHSASVLYVINSNNIVVSKFQVRHLFNNKTFGDMLVGYGSFKLSTEGYRVVQVVTNYNSGDSFIYKARGDYYYRMGDQGRAISEYKKSIELDVNNPAPRLSLGLIYYKNEIYNYAYAELLAAYKNIMTLYDNEDKFILLKSLAEIQAIEAYKNVNNFENRIKYRKEGIKFCKEALRINEKSVDVNYLLGEFYMRKIDSATDDDKLAREIFSKVIELNPLHSGANLRLSELYIRHNNSEKALYYAKKALEYDRTNQRALEIIKSYE